MFDNQIRVHTTEELIENTFRKRIQLKMQAIIKMLRAQGNVDG